MKLLNKTFIPVLAAIALVACGGGKTSEPKQGYSKIKEVIKEKFVSQGISEKVISYDYCLYAWPKKNNNNIPVDDYIVSRIYYSIAYTVNLSTPATYVACYQYRPRKPILLDEMTNLVPYQSAYQDITLGRIEGELGEL